MREQEKKNEMVIMDFSGVYRQETFYEGEAMTWVDLFALSGTNCYCDEEARAVLWEKIQGLPEWGLHFIDSGNYHYMSRIWLEKLTSPFRLLVFDNHTDLQPPAFGGILSCGGWIEAALRELPMLFEVILAGPDEEAFSAVAPELLEKICFLSREKLASMTREEACEFFGGIPLDLPLYISVDKDVLCREDVVTSWSQGDLKLSQLLEYLEIILENLKAQGKRPAGMDVCGEVEPGESGAVNDFANQALMRLWQKGAGYERNLI